MISRVAGLPSIWSVLKVCEQATVPAFWRRDHTVLLGLPSANAFYVVIAQRLILNDGFYQRAYMYAPTTLRCEAGPKTRKLFSIIITGNDATGKGVLFQCIKTTACINGATRKMIPAVGCDPASLQANPVRVQVIPVPVRHFRWRMRVAHSDTDVNQHVNQAMYCRYCTDAAASATHHGHLHYFRGDFYNYRVKQIDVLYQGEAFPDDELDVCVWEDENLANTLHFQILKGTSHVTFCTMLFNSPVISKL